MDREFIEFLRREFCAGQLIRQKHVHVIWQCCNEVERLEQAIAEKDRRIKRLEGDVLMRDEKLREYESREQASGAAGRR